MVWKCYGLNYKGMETCQRCVRVHSSKVYRILVQIYKETKVKYSNLPWISNYKRNFS